MARLCLNMIVKNESAIIERCLAAAAPHIDCYVICDTGSTDATKEIIKRFFEARAIPGEVLTIPFRNFEQARNDALDAARRSSLDFDYLLFCDADMNLQVDRPDFRSTLDKPVYMVTQRAHSGHLEYQNVRLVKRDLPSRYVGVTHEYLDIGKAGRFSLDGVWYLDHASGSNRAVKFQRDIALLLEDLAQNPDNSRSVFYLANSYFDINDFSNAIRQYERRTRMGGWEEEVFYSWYRIGRCYKGQGRDAEMLQTLLETFDRYPHRAEPLHTLALHYQQAGKHRLAFHFAEIGSRIAKPDSALFVEPEVYSWRLQDIMSVSLYHMGRRAEGRDLCKKLLNIVPESERPRVFKNLQWCEGGV
ncbi:MAG: glycosyltransferase [Planctomycetes bacterium]|nr:glycosyltransferase [Planctomycetota bacterium]